MGRLQFFPGQRPGFRPAVHAFRVVPWKASGKGRSDLKGLPSSVLRPDGSALPDASMSRNGETKPVVLVALTADKTTHLLAFPVFDPPITASDKNVLFRMNLSGIRLQAKFEPNKMSCGGRLDL
jgi:hypothetical protein